MLLELRGGRMELFTDKERESEAGGEGGGQLADEAVAAFPKMNLSYAESQHQVALDLLREEKLDEAIEILSDVLEWRTKTFGERGIECAPTWHHYGVALFKKARSSDGVMGEATKEGIRQLSQQIVTESLRSESGNGTSGADAEGAEDVEEDDDNDDEALDEIDNNGDNNNNLFEEANATQPDDMELAWQALEVARLIYSKNSDSHHLDLAEVHGSLAELSLERAHFETAITDYRTAIECMNNATGRGLEAVSGERRLADLQFRLCLAFQLDGTQKLIDNRTLEGQASIREGLVYCNRTSDTLQGLLDSLQAEADQKNDADVKELVEIMAELREKAKEMNEILEHGVTLPTVNGLLDQNRQDENDEPDHNFGVVGNKRSTVKVETTDSEGPIDKKLKLSLEEKARAETVSQTPAAD
eukprot:CAMPEP_0184492068 /NCGR_PEP_ID=MMETSP0113_2-20130426/22197_1 /TAXON_ID=91329 /ORGANISM="Norrisiella sphaerica, Strain BC52" /LENGTH=415 /DNA_ID=CAMNT_0026876703 /DNA_START=369 /DNA_END=1616 /DNA_ORIENTATION=+